MDENSMDAVWKEGTVVWCGGRIREEWNEAIMRTKYMSVSVNKGMMAGDNRESTTTKETTKFVFSRKSDKHDARVNKILQVV